MVLLASCWVLGVMPYLLPLLLLPLKSELVQRLQLQRGLHHRPPGICRVGLVAWPDGRRKVWYLICGPRLNGPV